MDEVLHNRRRLFAVLAALIGLPFARFRKLRNAPIPHKFVAYNLVETGFVRPQPISTQEAE